VLVNLKMVVLGSLIALALIAHLPEAAAAAWTQPTNVSPTQDDVSTAYAAVAPDNRVYAAWDVSLPPRDGIPSGAVRLATISTNGSASAPIEVTDEQPYLHLSGLAADNTGGAVVIWTAAHDGARTSVDAVRIAPDGVVGNPITLHTLSPDTGPGSISVVVAPDGTVTVVWESISYVAPHQSQVQMSQLSPTDDVDALKTLGSGVNPAAAIQPNGRVVVTWSGDTVTTIDAAGRQGPTVPLDPGHTGHSVAALALSSTTGEGAITWNRGDGEDVAVMVRRVLDDGSVGTISRVSPPGPSDGEPGIGTSSNGTSTIVWPDADYSETWAGRSLPDGTVAAPVRLDVSSIGASNNEYHVVVDPSGVSTIVWIDRGPPSPDRLHQVRAVTLSQAGTLADSRFISGADDAGRHTLVLDHTGIATALWGSRDAAGQRTRLRAARSAQSASCSAVQLIGVAGSGENGGPDTNTGNGTRDKPFRAQLGPTVTAFRDTLRKQLALATGVPSTTVLDDQPLDYPAIPVGSENANRIRNSIAARNNNGTYRASVDAGVAELSRVLTRATDDPCLGQTRYVLAGFSQGAQVIGDLLERKLVPDKLKPALRSVVLFGDPKFNFDADHVTARSSFELSRGGQLGRRAASAFRGYPSALRIHSYCRYQDSVCQDIPFWSDGGPHQQYPTAESSWAAWNTADVLFPGTSKTSWSPIVTATLIDNRSAGPLGGGTSIRLTCRVPTGGVCWARATVAYENWILLGRGRTETVRLVGRDTDNNGVVESTVKLDGSGRITRAQADLTATGISSGHVEKTTAISLILR
jgi:hypothetical protein